MNYRFTRMEWWRNRNRDGFGHAFVGFCENGDKYLTFDVRKEGDGYIPVFSPLCKVGTKNGHRIEAYIFYREKFYSFKGHQIQAVEGCIYKDLYEINQPHKFEL